MGKVIKHILTPPNSKMAAIPERPLVIWWRIVSLLGKDPVAFQ